MVSLIPASLFTTSVCICLNKVKLASTESISKYATGIFCHLAAVSEGDLVTVLVVVLPFPLKKRKNKTPTATSKIIFRASKPLFMQSFLQVNQSHQRKYNHSDYFRKQLTGSRD